MGAKENAPVYSNHNLFSNHFLENRLSDFDEWQEDATCQELYEEIRSLYEEKKSVIEACTNREAELESVFIRPILELLGFSFTVQATIQDSAKRPDYALFKSEDGKQAVFEEQDSPDFYAKAICVADAKAWDRDLDKKTGTGTFTNQNPSYQIDYYLRETDKEWGILTNGRKWRLYKEEVSHRLDTYFEVDLVECLERGPEAFKYFYFFFRKEAFVGDENAFLNRVYSQSATYAQSIGENLEDNVYKALLWMAKGYFAVGTNKLEKTQENLEEVYANSLIFLYRLIFVLYLESKGFLQSERIPHQFRNYDITRFVDTILEEMDNDTLNPYGGLHAYKLNQIFNLIDKGSQALGIPRNVFYIPAYNGGLFSDDKHPFISFTREEGKKIQDKYLARVVDFLTRPESPEHKGKGRIDYADLSIRHLGGIYEGLLEYKLRLAEEDLVPVRKSGSLVYMSLDEAKEKNKRYKEREIIREGDIYLATDKGERKATGSYYTPDYIVKYIVENTVGPVLGDKLDGCTSVEEKREAILSTKVLDPAMGSGHFLVEATDFIASELAEVTEPEEDKRDIDLARREVVKHCIYGVDLNHLAVELAKLSLWIATLSEDKPLTFLDHHLKVGNSLIGADLYDLNRHPDEEVDEASSEKTGQRTLDDMFEEAEGPVDIKQNMRQLLQMYRRIMERHDEKPDDIQAQTDIFHDLMHHQFRRRFHVLADVYTSYYFGNDFSVEQYHALLRELPPGSDWNDVAGQDWVRAASNSVDDPIAGNLARQKHFFHWQLEFPEIFFDIDTGTEKANPGFDAVIGNPPYVRMEQIKPLKAFLQDIYKSHASRTDLYVYFMERSVKLVHSTGKYGVIVSNKFLRADYGKSLRSFLSDKTDIIKMIDFGGLPVFPDATVRSVIVIATKETDSNIAPLYAPVESLQFKTLSQEIDCRAYEVNPDGIQGEEWRIVPRNVGAIMEKLEDIGEKLGNVVDRKICWGIKTGLNEAFFIDGETRKQLIKNDFRSKEIIKPLVKGTDIRQYHIEKKERWILYMFHGIDIGQYPAVEQYLQPYRKKLEERATEQAWYELQQPQEAYAEYFDGPKILYPEIAKEARFAFHPGPLYPNNKCFFIPSDDHYLTALLNSNLCIFYLCNVVAKLEGGSPDDAYYEFRTQYMEHLPVWRPRNDKIDVNIGPLLDWLKALYHNILRCANWANEYENGFSDLFDTVTEVCNRKPICPPEELATPENTNDNFPILVAQIEDWLSTKSAIIMEMAVKEFLGYLAKTIAYLHNERDKLNLNLQDYLRIPKKNWEGEKLGSLAIPPSGVGNSILVNNDYDSLRIDKVSFRASNELLTILLTARYKAENLKEYETDQWGYTETEPIPAMEFHGLSEMEQALVKEFVPLAIEKGGGFANFRKKATKTKSLLDRLEALTLPRLEDVEDGLKKYLEIKQRAEELDEQIKKTDELIDQIVYRLYELTDEEIAIVEESIQR